MVSMEMGDLCTLLLVFIGVRCTRGTGPTGVRCTFGVLVVAAVVVAVDAVVAAIAFSSLGVGNFLGVVFIGVTRRGVDDDGGSSSACNNNGVYGIKDSIVTSSSSSSSSSSWTRVDLPFELETTVLYKEGESSTSIVSMASGGGMVLPGPLLRA